MSRFKDFGTGKYNPEEAEQLSFKLYDEEFICTPAVQGKFLINLIAGAGDEENSSRNLEIISEFFENVLEEESNERFQALLQDKKKIVTVETLGEIVAWLMSEYTNRPNQQPEDS